MNFVRDCRLGKTLRKRQKKVIGVARCLKYIQILRKLSSWLSKPFDEVAQEDMEKLIEALENNKYKCVIKGKNGQILREKKYTHSTKLDYKKTIKKFYKWLLGNNENYPSLVDWIETYDKVIEISALRREEAEKLVAASKVRDKAIIMFLFDSGVRAEELLNIKLCDLTKKDGTYKVRIVHSKTKPRTIYIPICSKYLEMWLQDYNDKNDQDYLFPLTYDSLRMMLHRVGKTVLGKRVTPHILRHSSVTYYANLINNPYKLCYRYGWAMSSKEVNRYLDREGLIEEETVDLVKTNDISRLEKQNQTLKEEISLIKDSNSQMEIQFEKHKKEVNNIFEGKEFIKVLKALFEKHQKILKVPGQINHKAFDRVLQSH